MKKVLFIDRDGTLIQEPPDEQVDSLEKLVFMPGVFRALTAIRERTDYRFVMVTNQDGLGSASFPEERFWPAHNHLINTLRGEGIEFDEVLIDRHFPSDNAPTRKPGTAMLKTYLDGSCDMERSYVIGDREVDEQLARNLGCRALRIGPAFGWEKVAEGQRGSVEPRKANRKKPKVFEYRKLNL